MAKNSNTFWSSNALDPKRSYRWILALNEIPTYVVKTSGKPQFTIESIQHQFVAHTFYYPGRIQWQELQVTLVDPVYPDASSLLIKTLQASGYALPGTMNDAKRSFSKKDAVAALGTPSIQQIDANGKTIEKWTLWNPWLSAVNFGELSYENDAMVNVQITFRYDWAEYEGSPDEGTATPVLKKIMRSGEDQTEQIQNAKKDLGVNS
jgi:hypothetical protein